MALTDLSDAGKEEEEAEGFGTVLSIQRQAKRRLVIISGRRGQRHRTKDKRSVDYQSSLGGGDRDIEPDTSEA